MAVAEADSVVVPAAEAAPLAAPKGGWIKRHGPVRAPKGQKWDPTTGAWVDEATTIDLSAYLLGPDDSYQTIRGHRAPRGWQPLSETHRRDSGTATNARLQIAACSPEYWRSVVVEGQRRRPLTKQEEELVRTRDASTYTTADITRIDQDRRLAH